MTGKRIRQRGRFISVLSCQDRNEPSPFCLDFVLRTVPIVLLVLVALVTVLLVAIPTSAFAEENTTIRELNETTQRQSKQVTVKGEAVGDILNAQQQGYKWLLLLDDESSISVFLTDEDAQKITWLGRYDQKGTILEISGEFHVDCDDHDGLTDIHATSVKVIEEGYKLESHFDGYKIGIGALLIVAGAALSILHWRLRERTR